MGDRFSMTLMIGGDIGEHDEELLRDLHSLETSEEIEHEEHIRLFCYDVSGDHFNELTAKLRGWGIPYDCHNQAKWEFDGAIVFWRPGMAEPQERLATQDASPVLCMSTLEHCLEKGQSLADVIKEFGIPPLPEVSHSIN